MNARKMAALIAATGMGLGLTACSANTDSDTPTSQAATEPATTEPTTTEPEVTEKSITWQGETDSEYDFDKAESLCQKAVEQKLVAPATAQWGNVRRYSSNDPDTNKWELRGTVDSENRYGALIRSRWSCEITPHPDLGWTARKVIVTDW